jgi:hypothetical protein
MISLSPFYANLLRCNHLRGDMMIKLDTSSVSLTYPTSSYQELEAARRLIVLVPNDVNSTAVTHRVWKLAQATGCQILFLSLCTDGAEESSLRRQLITMSAMIQDGKLCAEARVEIGSNWVNVVRSELQDGDMIVCFAEQRAGLLHRPLSQILQSNIKAPVYILSGLAPQDLPRSNWLSQIFAWVGSIGIIIGFCLLQVRITSLSQDWAQTTLVILSVIGETWLIWGWNSLFS